MFFLGCWQNSCLCNSLTLCVNIWALGCIFAELITTKPLFPGKEKDPQNPNLFQTDQVRLKQNHLAHCNTVTDSVRVSLAGRKDI